MFAAPRAQRRLRHRRASCVYGTVERWVATARSTAYGFRIAQYSCSAPRQNHSLTASTFFEDLVLAQVSRRPQPSPC